MKLNLRPAEECTFDAVSLGEVMLRLDPGEGRIRTARSFRAWEGGGEYNVIRGLHKCFGMNTADLVSVALRAALTELTQLSLRLHRMISISTTSSRTRAMVV